jgi:hypothetical protein
VSYRRHAPLCLAGETRPIESALVERISAANPSKDTLPGNPQFVRAYLKPLLSPPRRRRRGSGPCGTLPPGARP